MQMNDYNMDADWLRDRDGYVDILKKIIEYEESIDDGELDENRVLRRYNEENDVEHTVNWDYSDVGVNPTRLYQLELHGFVDRVYDSSSKTLYSMSGFRDDIKSTIDDLESEESSGGFDGVRDGEYAEVYYDFPDSEDELPDDLFNDIVGMENKKWILKRGLTTDDITNFLLLGPAGTAKSVFLLSIFEYFESSEYIVASEATSAGVLDQLFDNAPMIFLVDEFDDMKHEHQSVFSSYTETGILKETKSGKDRKLETNIKTFAAANNKDEIKGNIYDRFTVLEFEPYTHDEFIEICEGVLKSKEGKTKEEARDIADAVWDYKEEGDIRLAIQVARLSRGDPKKVVGVIADSNSGDQSWGLQ